MAPAQLLNLPTELLEQIVFMVRQNGDGITGSWSCNADQCWTSTASQADLAAVAATCKRLNAFATRDLYYAPSPKCHPLLLRTLLHRPDLAPNVHALDVNYWSGYDRSIVHIFSTHDLPLAEAAASRFGFSLPPFFFEIRDWERFWCCGSEFSMALRRAELFDILLILVSDTLEALRYTSLSSVSGGINSPLDNSEVVFRRLRFFAFSHSNEIFGLDLESREQFLHRCPNLEALWLNGCRYFPEHLNLGNLRSLRMTGCTLNLASLEDAIQACCVLEEFCCSSRRHLQKTSGRLFEMADAARLLRPMASTLRHLVLEPSRREARKGPDEYLGPLVDFGCLETLVVDAYYFDIVQGADSEDGGRIDTQQLVNLLPKGIKYLAMPALLSSWEYVPITQLAEASRQDAFPALKKVAFPFEYDSISGPPETPEWVRCHHPGLNNAAKVAFAAAGVQSVTCKIGFGNQCGLPTYDFVPGKNFLRPNANDW